MGFLNCILTDNLLAIILLINIAHGATITSTTIKSSLQLSLNSNSNSIKQVELTNTTIYQLQEPPTAEHESIERFRDYLKINTAHPSPNYLAAIEWLKGQAAEIGLDFHLQYFNNDETSLNVKNNSRNNANKDLFALWLTWNGTSAERGISSVLLNSHMDVVAADPAKWDHDPFSAYKDPNGIIYGRGAVDMKSATIAQLEAIRILKSIGFIPYRTIHISIMPDEELGGKHGMVPWLASPQFKALNIGFDIDEGVSTVQADTMYVYYGEKSVWQFNITVTGPAGHGSTIPLGTAAEKLQFVLNKLMEFRSLQLQLLASNNNLTMGDITSINLARIGGGIGDNIIPNELWASFDMRIRIKDGWNFSTVETMLNQIVKEAGPGCSIKYIEKSLIADMSVVNDSNPWWTELQNTCKEMNIKCVPDILSAGTDGSYIRELGIPVFGLNPFLKTFWGGHQDNESISENEFLAGIGRYAMIIKNIASYRDPNDVTTTTSTTTSNTMSMTTKRPIGGGSSSSRNVLGQCYIVLSGLLMLVVRTRVISL